MVINSEASYSSQKYQFNSGGFMFSGKYLFVSLLLIICGNQIYGAVSPAGKRAIFLKGSLSISGKAAQEEIAEEEDNYFIGIEGGYLFVDGLGIGLRFGYDRTDYTNSKQYQFSLGPQITVFPSGDTIRPGQGHNVLPYFGGSLMYLRASRTEFFHNQSGPVARKYSDDTHAYRIFLGLSIFLSQNAALSVEYDLLWYDFDIIHVGGDVMIGDDPSKPAQHSLSLGLCIYLW